MLVSDCIQIQRILLSTPSDGPGGVQTRWPDSYLVPLTDRAVKAVVADVLFPESRIWFTSIAGQQQYQLPAMHEIQRVYVNGQPIASTPGNIDTLEGIQSQLYNATGNGAEPPGSGGPPGGGGPMQPEWVVQTPVSYPYLNAWGSPAPGAQPYYPGQSPRYYFRGGYIGIVPAPIAVGAQITVEGVRIPNTLVSVNDTVVVPDNFMDAINLYVLWATSISNDSSTAQKNREMNRNDYDIEIRKLRTWARQYLRDNDQILPQTNMYRDYYREGGARSGFSGLGD
jgi:hypothetical protein